MEPEGEQADRQRVPDDEDRKDVAFRLRPMARLHEELGRRFRRYTYQIVGIKRGLGGSNFRRERGTR